MEKNTSSSGEPSFKWVAECLYRHPNTAKYYALVKKNGKQIRRSLKTTDRQLADRRLTDFRSKIGRLTNPTKGPWHHVHGTGKRGEKLV